MKLKIRYEKPHTWWAPLFVFDGFFEWVKENYSDIEIIYEFSDPQKRSNPSCPHSAHIMLITNLENNKYFIVSYWDRALELTWEWNGWNHKNNVDIFTSAGVTSSGNFTPFSYTCYSLEFERFSDSYRKPLQEKKETKLFFRGFLYGERLAMKNYKPEYFTDIKVSTKEYFDELNDNKICLSINGAGEICNRDIEILSTGSVLLRPKLTQNFDDPLIPDYHYISVEKVNDPILQMDLLIDKFEQVKNDHLLLEKISENGLNWYKQNGSTTSNIEILKKIINFDRLK